MNVHPLKRIAISGFALMMLLLVMPIGAQSSEERSNDKGTVQLDPDVVIGLIAWIVAKTGWVVQGSPPIYFIPHSQFAEIFNGVNRGKGDMHIRAIYSNKNHSVYLPEKWNSNDLHDRGALLHELVHHLQALNNVKAMCLAAYERQAFDLQFEWLREQGIQDPYVFMDINEFAISLSSQCRE